MLKLSSYIYMVGIPGGPTHKGKIQILSKIWDFNIDLRI